MAKEQRSSSIAEDSSGLHVSIQNVDTTSAADGVPHAAEAASGQRSDEVGTQVSSSSGSGKPPSLDGKSVTSGTTFALDEKESLRPDDSASVKAGEDEDLFSPSGSGLPSSRMGSEDGTRAFRDQLREISRMDPSRQAEMRPSVNRGSSQGMLYVPPSGPGVGPVPDSNRNEASQDSSGECPPDPRLLEALESPKDRIMVLKLEQDFVDFVKDSKEASLTLPQLNGYHRMLAHRLADYYMLGHVVEDSTAVQIYKTANCRLAPPLTAVAPPSTAASTPPPTGPQMKILRRGDNVGPTIANGSNAQSKNGSENGESGNDDEKKAKYPLSREEREAKYEAARKRIMGSARPSESTDEPSEKDISRSSSTAPKKPKKKQRNNSDDDFEARSAYSAYYATPYTSAGSAATYGYAPVGGGQEAQFQHSGYGHPMVATGSQQYGTSTGAAWQNQAAFQQQPQGSSPWIPNTQQPYDMSGDFQRAMSLQSTSAQSPQTSAPSNWPGQQAQQYGNPQQQWQGQSPYTPSFPPHAVHPYADKFRPSSSSSQTQGQPYAYGQLPSQTYPGRPPSNLEHPLPGSYKGKHFNPQSQTFVPNYNAPQPQNMGMQPFMSQVPQAGNAQFGGYGMPGSMQQQGKGFQQHASAYQQQPQFPPQPQSQQHQHQQHPPYQHHQMPMTPQQPHQTAPPSTNFNSSTRNPNQPLTHPLPQPVFPPKPSPNMPLPAKPSDAVATNNMTTPPKATHGSNQAPHSGSSQGSSQQTPQQGQGQGQGTGKESSSIAKWGTPSSLPAKPPPAKEPFDPVRFAQNQKGSSSTSGAQGQGVGTRMGSGSSTASGGGTGGWR